LISSGFIAPKVAAATEGGKQGISEPSTCASSLDLGDSVCFEASFENSLPIQSKRSENDYLD